MAETISARKGSGSEAASGTKPRRTRITKRKANENHARSYFEAIAGRDVDGVVAHWKEDGVVDLVPLGILRGQDEIAAFFREMFAAFPDAGDHRDARGRRPDPGRGRMAHDRPLHRRAVPGRRADGPRRSSCAAST